jgi:hypothetical protein
MEPLERILDFSGIGKLAFDGESPMATLGSLQRLAESAGVDTIIGHASAVVYMRVAMLLLPRVPTQTSYNVQVAVVRDYLRVLGVQAPSGLIDRIVETVNRIDSVLSGREVKKGWGDIHYKRQKELLQAQNHRCLVCGCELDLHGEHDRARQPELDHILPFVFGGNEDANIRVLCGRCNSGKRDHISFLQSDYVALNYFVKEGRHSTKELRFWVIQRDKSHCREAECDATSHSSALFVVLRRTQGRFIFDNLRTVCEVHVAGVPAEQRLDSLVRKPKGKQK